MVAHMASRGLRMRSFYYGKITNEITTIQTKSYSVKTINNVHKTFFPLLTILSIKLFRQTDETNMVLESWLCYSHITQSENNTHLRDGLALIRHQGIIQRGLNSYK